MIQSPMRGTALQHNIAQILDELEKAITRYDTYDHDYKDRLQHRGIKKGLQLAYVIVSNSLGFSPRPTQPRSIMDGARERC